MYLCKIVADSVNPSDCRITTFEISYPLFVHAEFLRHRILSRTELEDFSHSVASNRAIPTRRILSQVLSDPALPVWWGKNQPGMSAREELTGWRLWAVKKIWAMSRVFGVIAAWLLTTLGLHKQLANRRMMADQWVTQLVTGTDWANFFALRCHPDAQPEIRVIAEMMRDEMSKSTPRRLQAGEWHLPLCEGCEYWNLTQEQKAMVSASRAARFSLLNEKRLPWREEVAKAESLLKAGHMSPFEHQAQALATAERVANLRGWRSLRSTLPHENDFGKLQSFRASDVNLSAAHSAHGF